MSSRAMRRERWRDDHHHHHSKEDEEEEEEEDVVVRVMSAQKNAFAAFLMDDDSEDEEEEEEEEEEASVQRRRQEPTPSVDAKKKKKKTKKTTRRTFEEEDEIAAALKDIGLAEAPRATIGKGAEVMKLEENDCHRRKTKEAAKTSADGLLACDVRKLKAEDELKRMFSPTAGMSSNGGNSSSNRSSNSSSSGSGSSVFARPKAGWSNKSRAIGLAMKKAKRVEEKFRGDVAYDEEDNDEITYYQFSTGAA